jgi:membrane protein YdbS with pleckstrin-like domain
MISPMAIEKQLNPGEKVVFHTRTHPKKIFLPVIALIIVLAVAGVLTPHVSGAGLLAVWIVAAVLAIALVLRPVLVWLSATYTVTDRRLLTRTGILTRKGHDIPVNRISDVSSDRGLLDRMLGCGTLIISDASTHGRVALPDVPHVEKRQLQISELLYNRSQGDEGS